MKTRIVLYCIVLYCSIMNSMGQTHVTYNQLFTADGAVNTLTSQLYGVSVSGDVNIQSEDGFVRVLLHETNSPIKILVYETSSLAATVNSFSILEKCEESYYLNGIFCNQVEIQVYNATFRLTKLTYFTIANPTKQTQLLSYLQGVRDQKINSINSKLINAKMLWRAGESPYSDWTYAMKAQKFGEKFNLEGFDFYMGGIFDIYSKRNYQQEPTSLVKAFDWRKKHGANSALSPYWDGDHDTGENGNGWITSVKNQIPDGDQTSCWGTCYIFSATAVAEAHVNLHYNTHFNADLSEQNIINCFDYNLAENPCYGANQNYIGEAFDYLLSDGVINESCSPWSDGLFPCNSSCQNPNYRFQYTYSNGFNEINKFANLDGNGIPIDPNYYLNFSQDLIKEKLISSGPMQFSFTYHAMTLIGFDVAKVGDTIHVNKGHSFFVVEPGSPAIGKTYWIIKNSYGPDMYDNGYIRQIHIRNEIPQAYGYVDGTISEIINGNLQPLCRDEDGDGYYNWGLLGKPANCPPCPDLPDSDDSNPDIGPMDENYNPIILCEHMTYNPVPLIITKTQGWEETRYIHTDIVVKTGNTLIIRDEVLFAPGAKIVVERGAKLIVDGGVLKGACNNTWQGIELWGNKSQKQLATTQGTVELKNGAIIEDAVVAIQTYKPGSRSYSGGIIYADDAVFRNNQTDVLFEQYANVAAGTEYANLSYFKNCEFETTNATRFATITRHTWLNSVNGIKFYGCRFIERRTGLDVLRYGAKGIDASLSGFMVDNHPVTNQPCEFSNMLYGVYSSGLSNPARFSVSVRQVVFASWRGVYLRDITTATAELNQFSVPVYNVAAPAADYRYGLYLDACNTYLVQENQFTSNAHQLSPLTGSSFGLVVNSSGTFANQLYKNSFVGFGVASEAIGINNVGQTQYGLQFKCNDYTSSKYDMYVYGTSSTIASSQGSLTDPANNLFSNGGPILVSDLKNDGNFITYYHAIPQSNPRVVPLYYTSNKVALTGTIWNYDQNSCPSQISGQRNAAASYSGLTNTKTIISAMHQQLEQLTDEGNTEGLSLEVRTTIPQEAYQKYIDLMQTSPYISEEVLKSLGQNENGFSANMVRDVMVANPQSAKSEDVMGQLENRVNQLPIGIIKQIKKGKERVSAYENLKAEIRSKTGNQNALLSDGIISVINKDSLDNTNHVLGFYALLDEPQFKTSEAEIHFSRGEFTEVLSVLQNAINAAGNKEKEYYTQLNGFYSHVIDLLNNGLILDSLPQTEMEWLAGIEPDHAAFAKAQNLMVLNKMPVDLEPLFLPGETELKSGNIFNNEIETDEDLAALAEIYPNPAQDHATIFYQLEGYNNLELSVTDLLGKVVYRESLKSEMDAIVLNLETLKHGQYLISICSGKEKLMVKSLVVIQ